jgi:serine/threonine protein kinase
MADRLGTQVGNYRLTRLLGQGGFAEVYLGEQVHLGTEATVKLLRAPLATSEEVERFRQEARTIATLLHPQILRVLEFGIEAGLPYLILDYAPGGSLRERHPSGTQVPLAAVIPYVKQVASALEYAHDQQIIHRDIKPQNLLLGRSGEVLLSDFGISVVSESTSRQQTREFAGTAAYAAPEQIAGHPRPASDQYALGMVVYEWLTGRLPFTGGLLEVAWKQAHTPPPALRQDVPSLLPAVEEVVLTALAKDPRSALPGCGYLLKRWNKPARQRHTLFRASRHRPERPCQASRQCRKAWVWPHRLPLAKPRRMWCRRHRCFVQRQRQRCRLLAPIFLQRRQSPRRQRQRAGSKRLNRLHLRRPSACWRPRPRLLWWWEDKRGQGLERRSSITQNRQMCLPSLREMPEKIRLAQPQLIEQSDYLTGVLVLLC